MDIFDKLAIRRRFISREEDIKITKAIIDGIQRRISRGEVRVRKPVVFNRGVYNG